MLKNIDCSKFVIYRKNTNNIISNLQGYQTRDGYIYLSTGFNKFDNKETEIPDGYVKIDADKDFIKKYYCDKNVKLLTKDNEMYKNIKKTLSSKTKTYFIHDNGGIPFIVYVSGNNVRIFSNQIDKFYIDRNLLDANYKKNKWSYVKLIATYNAQKVFIGRSQKSKFDGNTILLQMTKEKYIIIANTISQFITKTQIIKYMSPIENNDVPYPYAIDT